MLTAYGCDHHQKYQLAIRRKRSGELCISLPEVSSASVERLAGCSRVATVAAQRESKDTTADEHPLGAAEGGLLQKVIRLFVFFVRHGRGSGL